MTSASISPEFLDLQRAVLGRYSLVRELGRGGMGIVFLAHDVALDRPVAIKMLPPLLTADEGHRTRFLREARTAAGLAHPNIVPIHAVEEHAGLVFFVMGYVDGETLGARVAAEGPLGPAEGAQVLQQVAWALGHAHARGIVHRDVKPDNILLERGTGRALVTDFGIAHVADADHTTGEGRILGTPRWMSPEQAAGASVDARSDIYSLGCVAYFALTGRPPFDDASVPALITKHASVHPPPVAERRPSVPPRLAAVVERCLAKRPDERFESAEALAAALRDSMHLHRDLPAPVRTFLRDVEGAAVELSGPLAAVVTSLALMAFTWARSEQEGLGFFDSLSLAVTMSAFGAVAMSMLGLAGLRVAQLVGSARRLLRQGYGHSAVVPALLVDERERRDETVGLQRQSQLWLGVRVALAVVCIKLVDEPNFMVSLVGLAGAIAIPTLAVRGLVRDLQEKGGAWWPRLMRGRLGRLLFRVAGIGRVNTAPRTPAPGEPTALVVGRAVEELFAALPAPQRQQFAALPALVARLEADALELRARAPVGDARRYAAALAAIETLRLDLLRAHTDARVEALGDLTRDLRAAERIGEEIAAALEGRTVGGLPSVTGAHAEG